MKQIGYFYQELSRYVSTYRTGRPISSQALIACELKKGVVTTEVKMHALNRLQSGITAKTIASVLVKVQWVTGRKIEQKLKYGVLPKLVGVE